MILGDLTDQSRNNDSFIEIVVEKMDSSSNNEWFDKPFGNALY